MFVETEIIEKNTGRTVGFITMEPKDKYDLWGMIECLRVANPHCHIRYIIINKNEVEKTNETN